MFMVNLIYDFFLFIFFVKKSEFYFFIFFSFCLTLFRSFSYNFSSFFAIWYTFAYSTILAGATAKIYFSSFSSANASLFTYDINVIKIIIILAWFILFFFLFTFYYDEFFEKNEFKLFSIDLALCGALLLADSSNLLEVFLALELIAFPTYTLISLEKTKESTEAALKYFIYSVYASLILIIGFVFLFSYSGQISFSEIILRADFTIIEASIFCFLIAVIVKLGIGPFFHWAPPVYQAVSAPIFVFISTISKVPLTLMFIYVAQSAFFGVGNWSFVSVIFLLIGGVFISARDLLLEKNIRRIIAYTTNINFSIGVIGFLNSFFDSKTFVIYVLFYLLSGLVIYVWHLINNSDEFSKNEISNVENFNSEDGFARFMISLATIINSGLPPITIFLFKISVIGGIAGVATLIHLEANMFLLFFVLVASLASYFAYFTILKGLNYRETFRIPKVWTNKKPLDLYIFANFITVMSVFIFCKLILSI